MTPEYFFCKLKLCEAHDLLEELDEREERASRLGFMHQRFTAGIIYKTLTGKVLDIAFPWENEESGVSEDVDQEEIERTRRELQRLNELNGNGNEDKRQGDGCDD